MLQLEDFFDDGKFPSVKRKVKKNKKKHNPQIERNHLELTQITPKTENQQRVFSHYNSGKNVVLHGSAGTGKTFLCLYLALKDVLENNNYQKVYIVRSAVPGRDVGFLPGTMAQKAEVYEAPYMAICEELFNRRDSYGILKHKNYVEFITTSYIRGTTLRDAVVIVDEVQNLDDGEILSILTRIGENCRVLVCGDLIQNDLLRNHRNQESGFQKLISDMKRMPSVATVQFGIEDICRSGFVKEYLIARENVVHNLSHNQRSE